MSSPTVSIIVPAYNYAAFLGETLDSVLAQTYAEWECVVVDDGSTDATSQVAERYCGRDRRFRLIRQNNRGLAAARNTALRATSGKYVQLLDADDCLMPDKLDAQVAFLEAHPDCAIVYGEVVYFRTSAPNELLHSVHGKLDRSIVAPVHGNAAAYAKLQHYNILHVTSALIRRSVFDDVGLLAEDVRGCDDYEFWIRAATAGYGYDYLEGGPFVRVRTHEASMSRDYEFMIRGLIDAAHAFRRWRPAAPLPLIYSVATGIEAAMAGRRRDAFRLIGDAARAASEALTAWRWRVYASAALLLPRRAFFALVKYPIPEEALLIHRRLRRLAGVFRR